MMRKFLIVKFRDARLIKSKGDFIIDYMFENEKGKSYPYTEKRNINNHNYFQEPITVYQISNMIHVLFGERPVPTHRTVFYQKNKYLFDKANDSYLKYTDIYHYGDMVKSYYNDKEYLINEFKILNKGHYNSNLKNPYVHWEILKNNFIDKNNIMDEDGYNIFINKCKEYLNLNPLEYKLIDIRDLIINNNLLDNFLYLRDKYYTKSVYSYLLTKDGSYLTGKKLLRKKNNKGVGKINSLNGIVAIPITDEDIEILKEKSFGTATLLDGGVVNIDSILLENELNLSKYTRVSDISTKLEEV